MTVFYIAFKVRMNLRMCIIVVLMSSEAENILSRYELNSC